VTISKITQWNNDSPVYIELSNSTSCYVPAVEKNLISLVLTMYAAGKKADIHCWDTADTYSGIPGHRVHRIITQ